MITHWSQMEDKRKGVLYMIQGALDLPNLTEYETEAHFLTDVLSRIQQARGLTEQIGRVLGSLGERRGKRI